MKNPIIHKKLSVKEILKRHKSHPQDKNLHKVIEDEGNNNLKKEFNNLIQQSTKQEPFDKRK